MRHPVTVEIMGSNPIRTANFGDIMDKKKPKKEQKQTKDWYVEFLKSHGVIVDKKGKIIGVPTDSRYAREWDY
jgi:hypothetical protein